MKKTLLILCCLYVVFTLQAVDIQNSAYLCQKKVIDAAYVCFIFTGLVDFSDAVRILLEMRRFGIIIGNGFPVFLAPFMVKHFCFVYFLKEFPLIDNRSA